MIVRARYSDRAIDSASARSITGEIALADVFVPEDHMLPNVKGLRGPFSCLNKARFGIAWGVMGALLMAVVYLHAVSLQVKPR